MQLYRLRNDNRVCRKKIDFLKEYTELEEIRCLSTLSNILKIINPNHLELCLYGIFSNVLKSKMKIDEKKYVQMEKQYVVQLQ